MTQECRGHMRKLMRTGTEASGLTADVHGARLTIRLLQGTFLSIFVTTGRLLVAPDDWSASERTAALLAAALAGAAAGGIFYATDGLRARGGLVRSLANIGTLLSYALLVGIAALLLFWIQQ
jgi:hypothetical protein